MARLNIYNKLGNFLESHNVDSTLTLWLTDNVPGYATAAHHPFSAKLNGSDWPHDKHNQTVSADDIIDVTIEPQDPATWVYVAITLLSVGYSYYVSSKIPNGYQESTPDGNSIYSPNAKANTAKPNGIIREIAGSVPIYPDLISPIRRKYESNIEYLYLNLCVCVGELDVDLNNLYIAETPSLNYAGDISAQFSQPGSDVSGHPSYENWYTTDEISDLKLVTSADSEAGAWTIDASGDQMTSYDNGTAVTFPFAIDERFTLTGSTNAGTYRVASVSGSNGETATVVEQIVTRYWDGAEDDPRYSQGGYVTEYYDAESTSLTTTTGESVNWGATSGGVNWEGPFEVLPQGETTDTIEVDFRFPRGLARTENDGSLSSLTVAVKVAYREVGTSTWTELDYSYTNNTLDELGFTESITLSGVMRPEVRVRRVTADAGTTSTVNDIHCVRIRSLLESPTSYADVTTLQIRLRGTNALAQTAENKINIRGAQRKLPTLKNLKDHIQNSESLSVSATSSIMRFVAWSIYDASGEDIINWSALEELETLLESRGDSLNADFSDKTTLWEALKIMLIPAYCEPSIKEGFFSPVRFAETDDYNNLYTPDIMLDSGITRTDTHFKASEPKGIIVEYLDPVTSSNETVKCFLPGDHEAKAKRIQMKGVTDKTRAWRLGWRERYRLAFKPATYNFSTATDALNSDYGSPDALVSPLKANQSFFVTDYSSPMLTLDFEPEFEAGQQYLAVLRKPNGQFSGVYSIQAGASNNQIELVSPNTLDFQIVSDPQMEPTICCIGTADELVQRVFIRNIQPSGTETVKVTAEEYIPEIFQNDDSYPD